jgi:NHL repeat
MTAEPLVTRVRCTKPVPGAGRVVALARPLLSTQPLIVLGAARVPALVTTGLRPERHTCFGPRGAALLGPGGPLWVCDTGHHRLLGWRRLPEVDEAPADWVIGQPSFADEGRNGRGPVHAASFNVPTGIARFGEAGLAVADPWNHRVLLWNEAPHADGVPADIVLGQPDFCAAEPNRGRPLPAADSLFWPYGVAWCDGCLFVADAENRRVLMWRGRPERNGEAADLVLGQARFDRRDENGGGSPDAASMRWPHGICVWRGRLCVSDAGNNRVMVYAGLPRECGQAAQFLIGQSHVEGVDHNQSSYWPRAATLNMPYGITAAGDWLLCADTANSRLLGFHVSELATGMSARALTGQADFQQKGDNRWQAAAADSVCWPYAIDAHVGAPGSPTRVVVADSGNNRVSVWELTA